MNSHRDTGNTHYKFGLFLADNKPFASRRLRRLTQNLRVASPSLPSGRYTRRRGIKASVLGQAERSALTTTEPLGSQRSTKPKAKSTMRVLRRADAPEIFMDIYFLFSEIQFVSLTQISQISQRRVASPALVGFAADANERRLRRKEL